MATRDLDFLKVLGGITSPNFVARKTATITNKGKLEFLGPVVTEFMGSLGKDPDTPVTLLEDSELKDFAIHLYLKARKEFPEPEIKGLIGNYVGEFDDKKFSWVARTAREQYSEQCLLECGVDVVGLKKSRAQIINSILKGRMECPIGKKVVDVAAAIDFQGAAEAQNILWDIQSEAKELAKLDMEISDERRELGYAASEVLENAHAELTKAGLRAAQKVAHLFTAQRERVNKSSWTAVKNPLLAIASKSLE